MILHELLFLLVCCCSDDAANGALYRSGTVAIDPARMHPRTLAVFPARRHLTGVLGPAGSKTTAADASRNKARSGLEILRKAVKARGLLRSMGFNKYEPKLMNELERKLLLSSLRRITSFLKRSNLSVTELFAKIDVDGSGTVDETEFREGFLGLGLNFQERAMRVMLKYMDDSGDGELDIEEFESKMAKMLEAEAATPKAILSGFVNYNHKQGITARELFEQLDEDGSGELDAAEFHKALETVGIHVGAEAARAAMDELDLDGDRNLEVDELLHRLAEFRRQRRVFATSVLGKLLDHVQKTRTSVVRVFARVDTDGSGDLDVVELQEAMRSMGQDLNELEVEEIMRELSSESGGTEMTCAQFMDKLKQFQTERRVATEKCRSLYDTYDADGSGSLDRNEVEQLGKSTLAQSFALRLMYTYTNPPALD